MVNVLSLGVEMVDDNIAVAEVAGSEDDNLEVLGELCENGGGCRTNIDANLEGISFGEFNGEKNITVDLIILILPHTMDESFIKVKNDGFLI